VQVFFLLISHLLSHTPTVIQKYNSGRDIF